VSTLYTLYWGKEELIGMGGGDSRAPLACM